MEPIEEQLARLREDVEEALYYYIEALGYDAANYPLTEFTDLMDELETQEVIE